MQCAGVLPIKLPRQIEWVKVEYQTLWNNICLIWTRTRQCSLNDIYWKKHLTISWFYVTVHQRHNHYSLYNWWPRPFFPFIFINCPSVLVPLFQLLHIPVNTILIFIWPCFFSTSSSLLIVILLLQFSLHALPVLSLFYIFGSLHNI